MEGDNQENYEKSKRDYTSYYKFIFHIERIILFISQLLYNTLRGYI